MSKGRIARSTIGYILLAIAIVIFVIDALCSDFFIELRRDMPSDAGVIGYTLGMIITLLGEFMCIIFIFSSAIPSVILLGTTFKGAPNPKKTIDIIVFSLGIALMVATIIMLILSFII